MTNYLVEGAIYWIHELPSKNVVSNTIGTAGIVPGRLQPNFYRKMIAFGTYAIAYVKTKNDIILIGVL